MIAASLLTAGVISLLTSIIIARLVSVTEFGIYSITLSLQSVLVLLSSFSIGTAVAKFVAEYNVRDMRRALGFARTGLRIVLPFSTVTAIVYFALAGPIGNGLYKEPEVVALIPFSALVVFSSATQSLVFGIARGNHRINLMSSMQLSTPIISLGIIVVLFPYVGIRAAFIGIFLAQTTVTLVALYRLGRTGFPLAARIGVVEDTRDPKLLLSYAVPVVIGSVVVIPLYWLGSTLLALEFGFLTVGQFAIAMVFFQALLFLPSSVTIPLVPRVSEMGVGPRENVGILVSQSMRAVSVLLFPIFFAVALFSKDLIGVLYESRYQGSSDAAYLMVTAAYYVAIASIVEAAIAGIGRTWVWLGLNLLWAAVFTSLVLITTPVYGAAGLGMAFAISYGVHLANTVVVSNKVLRLRIGNVLVVIIVSVVLFTAGFLSLVHMRDLAVLVRLILFAFSTGLMFYLGRGEFSLVLKRLLRR
jgi:O-antigen/teichoic acid export membrane protein